MLFLDEVHRFNKSQQDAFLPFVEDGTLTFIGATTENPSFELNNALLSRARVYVLKTLGVAYDDWSATSGLDIGTPPFTPDRFRELKEISRNIEASASLAGPWHTGWSLYYSRTVSGRNTGIKHVSGLSITRSF